MVLDFILDRARIEKDEKRAVFTGSVPELRGIAVEAETEEECRARLRDAVFDLLSREALGGGVFEQDTAPNPQPRTVSAGARGGGGYSGDDPVFSEIRYEKKDWVATVTIDREDVYNQYSSTTLREMTEAFRDAGRDDSVAVVVLTGAGDRAFCTGGDVRQHVEQHKGRPQEFYRWMGLLIEAHEALRDVGKPTIARINGLVAGGGNEWNLACDLAVAVEDARFSHIETSIGLASVCGGAQWLPLVIGDRRAREMLLTGEPITAERALEWGLVNGVTTRDELDELVAALCKKIIDRFPGSTRYTRNLLSFWRQFVWESTIEQAREWLSGHIAGIEVEEGLDALAEGRDIDHRSIRSNLDLQGPRRRGPRWSRAALKKFSAKLSCPACGASGLPGDSRFCGFCGGSLS